MHVAKTVSGNHRLRSVHRDLPIGELALTSVTVHLVRVNGRSSRVCLSRHVRLAVLLLILVNHVLMGSTRVERLLAWVLQRELATRDLLAIVMNIARQAFDELIVLLDFLLVVLH